VAHPRFPIARLMLWVAVAADVLAVLAMGYRFVPPPSRGVWLAVVALLQAAAALLVFCGSRLARSVRTALRASTRNRRLMALAPATLLVVLGVALSLVLGALTALLGSLPDD